MRPNFLLFYRILMGIHACLLVGGYQGLMLTAVYQSAEALNFISIRCAAADVFGSEEYHPNL